MSSTRAESRVGSVDELLRPSTMRRSRAGHVDCWRCPHVFSRRAAHRTEIRSARQTVCCRAVVDGNTRGDLTHTYLRALGLDEPMFVLCTLHTGNNSGALPSLSPRSLESIPSSVLPLQDAQRRQRSWMLVQTLFKLCSGPELENDFSLRQTFVSIVCRP